jgi:hypothetical protein
MNHKRLLAAFELLLVFPASLFMAALFLRNVQPEPYEPAQSARRLVDWFSARPFLCLDIFLIAFPLAAFAIGCASVLRGWRHDAELRRAVLQIWTAVRGHCAAVLIAAATLIAGSILAIVAVHVITD